LLLLEKLLILVGVIHRELTKSLILLTEDAGLAKFPLLEVLHWNVVAMVLLLTLCLFFHLLHFQLVLDLIFFCYLSLCHHLVPWAILLGYHVLPRIGTLRLILRRVSKILLVLTVRNFSNCHVWSSCWTINFLDFLFFDTCSFLRVLRCHL